MAVSKMRSRAQDCSPSPSPMLPLIKLLFVLLILLLLPDLVTSRRRGGRAHRIKRKKVRIAKAYQTIRSDCMNNNNGHDHDQSCGHLNLAENEMCVTKCMNPDCHDEIYGGGNELESGEVDEVRALKFESCVKDSIKKEEVEERRRRKERQKGDADVDVDANADEVAVESTAREQIITDPGVVEMESA